MMAVVLFILGSRLGLAQLLTEWLCEGIGSLQCIRIPDAERHPSGGRFARWWRDLGVLGFVGF